jgi:hypothetical protein
MEHLMLLLLTHSLGYTIACYFLPSLKKLDMTNPRSYFNATISVGEKNSHH